MTGDGTLRDRRVRLRRAGRVRRAGCRCRSPPTCPRRTARCARPPSRRATAGCRLDIVVDVASIEVFAGDGEAALTMATYGTAGERGLQPGGAARCRRDHAMRRSRRCAWRRWSGCRRRADRPARQRRRSARAGRARDRPRSTSHPGSCSTPSRHGVRRRSARAAAPCPTAPSRRAAARSSSGPGRGRRRPDAGRRCP